MRKLFGIGTPRALQKGTEAASPAYLLVFVTRRLVDVFEFATASVSVVLAVSGVQQRALAPVA